jgi:hypothetical protein
MVARALHNSAISENRCNFLDNDQHFLDNRWGDLVIAKGYSRVSLCLNLLDCAPHCERSMISSARLGRWCSAGNWEGLS